MTPAVYTVPPHLSFVDALADGLLSGRVFPVDLEDPLALSRMTVLLPTRRACRTLQDAMLERATGGAFLLPRIAPVADAGEDEAGLDLGEREDGAALPPAISPLARRLRLAHLIHRLEGTRRGTGLGGGTVDHAVRLAQALEELLDEIQISRLDARSLRTLAPEDYAAHWQDILRFLTLVTDHWPAILAEEGLMDPVARRNALSDRLRRHWEGNAPENPVIAAGSTGSVPATADLLAAIARLPQGCIVLPGLDVEADDRTWDAIGPTHPQHALKRLLERLEIERGDVCPWPAGAPRRGAVARTRLIADAMRPAETTTAWRTLAPLDETTLHKLQRIDCANPHDEAGIIALILREQLETPGRSAALVTADRALARRVAAELHRWGIEVDDSGGTPLGDTAPGTFLRLTAQLGAEKAAPIPLLAALKHPLAAGGQAQDTFRRQVRRLERAVLRGPRPAPGIEGLLAALGAGDPALRSWLAGLKEGLSPFAQSLDRPRAALRALLAAHVGFAEWLAASDDETGTDRLWSGAEGAAAHRFVSELADAAPALPPVAPSAGYPALLDVLMEGQVVRPVYGRHPRLQILGPLEARLRQADCMILGGLNEDSWPRDSGEDPWMSRPMRTSFGLPPLEHRIGLSAHDFAQCCGAETVYLTRSTRVGGTPTLASRWLTRLDAMLDRETRIAGTLREREGVLRGWWASLDRPDAPPKPWPRPEPRPPVSVRPRELSVTRIETWLQDPYSIYARTILGLKPLEPIDADPTAAERGIAIHGILEEFLSQYGDALPDDAERILLKIGSRRFAETVSRPAVLAFWQPRFARIARWFVDTQRARQGRLVPLATEVKGTLPLPAPGGPFVLSAVADRIDRAPSGSLEIVDYKTGAIPSGKAVIQGRRPQLPLEAAIAAAGGFEGVPANTVETLAYWKLIGAETAGEIKEIRGDPRTLADECLTGLQMLVSRFDDAQTPYRPATGSKRSQAWNDYAHLARVKEWSVAGEDDG